MRPVGGLNEGTFFGTEPAETAKANIPAEAEQEPESKKDRALAGASENLVEPAATPQQDFTEGLPARPITPALKNTADILSSSEPSVPGKQYYVTSYSPRGNSRHILEH